MLCFLIMDRKFKKKERIISKSLISYIFKKGIYRSFDLFRVFYIKKKIEAPSKAFIMISVPKRNIQKAVDRNQIKRRIISSYQENKSIVSGNEKTYSYWIIFIYRDRQILSFKKINQAIKNILHNLC